MRGSVLGGVYMLGMVCFVTYALSSFVITNGVIIWVLRLMAGELDK